MSEPRNSIRIAEDGEDFKFEITGDLAQHPADAVLLMMEATASLIGAMAKPEVDLDQTAEAYGTVFAKHVAEDIRLHRERKEAKEE